MPRTPKSSTAKRAPDSPALRSEQRSGTAAPREAQACSVRSSEIARLDIYLAQSGRDNAPINVCLHGGAWRNGLAKDYAFAAEMFVLAGAHLVIPDFVWVQDAGGRLEIMAEQVFRAIAWVHNNARAFCGDPARIYISGHSSGAHLAAVALTTDWQKRLDVPADTIKGALCCSGIYDLRPVPFCPQQLCEIYGPKRRGAEPAATHREPSHNRRARLWLAGEPGVSTSSARLRRSRHSSRQARATARWRRIQPLRSDRNDGEPIRPYRPSRTGTDEFGLTLYLTNS